MLFVGVPPAHAGLETKGAAAESPVSATAPRVTFLPTPLSFDRFDLSAT